MPPPSGGYPFTVLGRFEILSLEEIFFKSNKAAAVPMSGTPQGTEDTDARQGWAGENAVRLMECLKMRFSPV